MNSKKKNIHVKPQLAIETRAIFNHFIKLFYSNNLDPSPWLIVTPELKIKLKAKPYDPKKSCWVPNKVTHGYDEGLIESTEGDKVTVMVLESKEVFDLLEIIIEDIQKY